MELTTTGAIRIDGHLARFTDDGKWMVSRHGTVLGYVDSVGEISPLIEKERERVRARLALVQRKAEERKAEEKMPAEILAATKRKGFSPEMVKAHNIEAPAMRTLTDAEFLSKVEDILP